VVNFKTPKTGTNFQFKDYYQCR